MSIYVSYIIYRFFHFIFFFILFFCLAVLLHYKWNILFSFQFLCLGAVRLSWVSSEKAKKKYSQNMIYFYTRTHHPNCFSCVFNSLCIAFARMCVWVAAAGFVFPWIYTQCIIPPDHTLVKRIKDTKIDMRVVLTLWWNEIISKKKGLFSLRIHKKIQNNKRNIIKKCHLLKFI